MQKIEGVIRRVKIHLHKMRILEDLYSRWAGKKDRDHQQKAYYEGKCNATHDAIERLERILCYLEDRHG